MKKHLLLLVLLVLTVTFLQAGTWYVSPAGTDDLAHGTSPGTGAFQTIQYAISRALAGDVIKIAAGTYTASNILVDKSLTIEGTGATRDAVVIVPSAEDGNQNVTFDGTSQNGFIIKASNITIRKLTINGRGNNGLTPGKNNFRTGIVTLDDSQPGGGIWNNLHVDNVYIKYTYRRGISVFPRSVSGTVVENSRVDNVAYNHGMYLAGQCQAVNNTITHCFQGIVVSTDASTPRELIRINGNTLTRISNFPGCIGDQGSGNYTLQPRAIEADHSGPGTRNFEIRNNVIDDLGSVGLRGTVGIYTRRANSSSIVENNTITLTSGASFSTGGSQSVGLLLGWSYDNGFMVRNNTISSSGYGMGMLLFAVGTSEKPMYIESNTLTGVASLRTDTADGTGIYIANQYLFAADNKNQSNINLRNGNNITGYVRGLDVVDCPNSSHPLAVTVKNNSFAGTTTGIEASTLSFPLDATNNYWGGNGPKDAVLYPGATGSAVSPNIAFIPWWCDAAMTLPCPALDPMMAIMNTTSGIQYPSTGLQSALDDASSGQTLYVAPGTVDGITFNYPGKTLQITGTGVPGQSVIAGTSPALSMVNGNLSVAGVEFTMPAVADPTISVTGGTLKLRHCIMNETAGGNASAILVSGGAVDAGTAYDFGMNKFLVIAPGAAVENTPAAVLWAVGNNWGHPSGPSIASNFNGTGGSIIGTGADEVVYAPYAGGPVTTISRVTYCEGTSTVDIPVTVTNFNNIGSLALTFGFTTPAQLSSPTLIDVNPAFAGWDPFTVTTDPQLLNAGIYKVSGFGSTPSAGVSLPDESVLFTLRFSFSGNAMASVSFIEEGQGIYCEYASVAPGNPFIDVPTTDHYLAGGVDFSLRQKISGTFTYYNPANIQLTSGITVGLYQDGNQVGPDYTVSGGTYEFTGLCPGTYEIRATSTKPTDGSVNTTDAAQVNNWGPHPFAIEKVRFYAGDVTQDNFLSATDAQTIQQHFVNGTAFIRQPWTFWNAGTTISQNPFVPIPDYPAVTLVSGSDLTVNMYGLCTGDFNRSFNPLVKEAASKNLTLVYGRSMLIEKNQEFDLPIRIVPASNVGAVSLILNLPSDLVEVLDVTMNSITGELDWALRENELRIGWNSLEPVSLASNENLLILKLKTRETFTQGNSIRLELVADPLNELADDVYDVIENAVISVDVVESSPIGIHENQSSNRIAISNHPNPFSTFTTISYTLPFAGASTLEIRNALGEPVTILSHEIQPAGTHSVKLDASSLPQGVYTATLRLEGKSNAANNTIKLIISR
jgi:hypothetical protein